MILNRTYNYLFVHVPKAAGTAITARLRPHCTPLDIEISDPPEADVEFDGRKVRVNKHATALEIRDAIGGEEFGRLFKFASVRNPYARTYSIYRFLKFNHRAWNGSDIMDAFRTFDEFIASDFFATMGPDGIFAPQSQWVCDTEGQLMVDHIVRTEHLDADLAAISDRLGISPDEHTVPINVSERESLLPTWVTLLLPKFRRRGLLPAPEPLSADLAKVYGNERTRVTIETRYAQSFDLFGYLRLEFAGIGDGARAGQASA